MRLIWLILFLCHTALAVPPIDNNMGAMADLLKTYRSEQEYINKAFSNNNGWYIKYSLSSKIIEVKARKINTVNTIGEMMASINTRYTKAGNTEVYLDKDDVFTIDHDRKAIVRMQSTKEALTQKNPNYIDLLNDSIAKQYVLISKSRVIDAGKTLIRYDLKPKNSNKSTFVEYSLYVDTINMSFYKVHAVINPQMFSNVKEYTLTVLEKKEKTLDERWSHVREQLMTPDGRLKHPYEHYSYKHYNNNPQKK